MTFTQGHALVIGVGSHQSAPQLDVPISAADATAVAQALQDSRACGYPPGQVKLLSQDSATKSGILTAIVELAQRVKPEDTALFFYCGHSAVGTDGSYYLVSHDTEIDGGQVVKGTGVSEDDLTHALKAIRARRLLMIFNACLSGNVSPNRAMEDQDLEADGLPEPTSEALLRTGEGRVIITACQETQESHIGKGPVTIFTQALVDGLRGKGSAHNNGGYIGCFDLYENVHEHVTEAVQEQFDTVQEPALIVLEGAQTFAVALFKGATALGTFDASRPLPTPATVRQVEPEVTNDHSERKDERRGEITVGNIEGSKGVAIGAHARAFVQNVYKVYTRGGKKLQELILKQQKLSVAIGALTILVVLVILGILLRPFFARPKPMTGDVNVAVAQFGEQDAQGRVVASEAGSALADSFYKELGAHIDELKVDLEKAESGELKYDIQLRGPCEVGRIGGTTAQEREKNAAKLAQEIQADVIVYGYLQIADNRTTFTPEFYVSDQKLTQAYELTGQLVGPDVQVPDNITKNPPARSELRQKLLGGPQVLSVFIIGLGNYIYYRYDAAQTYFRKALDAADANDAGLRKIFLLFLGKTAHETRDWDTAQDYYSQALAIQPQFARAQLGFADTIFQKAKGNCERDNTNAAELERAINEYQQALTCTDQSPLSDVSIKVSFHLGRAYSCQSLAQLADRWSDAENQTEVVIQAYEKGNDRIKLLTSEAHANLAVIYWSRPAQDAQSKTDNLQRAVAEYQAAIELSNSPDLQSLFHQYVARLYEVLHEYDKADKEWRDAIRLETHPTPTYPTLQQQFLKARQATSTPD